jgi:S1/P1 Nuclease
VARGAVASHSLCTPHLAQLLRQFLRAGISACLLLIAIVSIPAPAHAWGCEGHQVVALLAEKHLTPRALAMTKKILADSPIDPSLSRYCKQGGSDPLADAATWPDDMRGLRPETAPWHYVDIPLGTTVRDVQKYCDPKEGCVTRAIAQELATLRSTDADPKERADALRFLIHFVGDLHQPLHATTNNDQGGNCVPVTFFDTLPQLRNPQTEGYAPNLHGVWDTNILERATTGKTVDQVAAELDQSFQRKIAGWQKGPANVDAWAWESYQLAVRDVYGKLPVRIPVESPQPIKSCADDNHVSARNLKLNEKIEDPYQDMAVPIIRQQVAKAGARLALLLNQLWPQIPPFDKLGVQLTP